MSGYATKLMLATSLALTMGGAASAESSSAGNDEEQIAADLANPLAPITTVFVQYRAEIGSGPDDDVNHQLRLQPSFFKPFADRAAVLLRTIIPFASRRFPVDASGMGDVSLIPYYVPDTTTPTFLGYGAALGLPTATDASLGSGKWTAGPALLLAKTGQPITYGGLLQHVWSLAGDGDRRNVSVTTTQLFITYLLGGGWSSTITSETSYDWEADSDNWTIPVNVGVSKVVEIGGRYFNLGLTGVYYVEASSFSPDWEVRANFTYVIR